MRWARLLVLLSCIASPLLGMAATPAPAPEKVVTYLSWTPAALYLAFNVEARMVVGNSTLPLGQPWHDDAVAIYLDLQPTGATNIDEHCVRVVVSAAGGATVQRGDKGEWRDEPAWFQPGENGTIRYGVRVLGKINDSSAPAKGYQVEMALAWNLLRVEPPIRDPSRADEPLPAIGCAIVSYAQGEGQAVSCWPKTLREVDLNNPSTWGKMAFLQGMLPQTSTDTLANVTLAQDSPLIDGDINGPEWMTAGIVAFPKRWTATPIAPTAESAQAISLVAAWYLLDPALNLLADTPLEPVGPWAGPDTPCYHLQQIDEARRAGIDALAVALPVDGGLSAQTRDRLAALVSAIRTYDHARSGKFYTDSVSLLPVLDCSHFDLAADGKANWAALQAALEAFYRLTPPQYRTMTSNATHGWCYPVLLVAPTGKPAPAEATTALAHLSATLQEETGVPIGWMLDAAWKDLPQPNGTLTCCAWDASAGLQQGNGPVRVVLVSPGMDASHNAYLPRREGELYENGWLAITTAHPDIVLIRSWNDFAQGTEIAASRQYSYQFVDSTRLATIRLAEGHGLHLRLLRHDLPPVLAPGRTYPVEVLVKNAGMEKLLTNEGFRVDYRITRGEETLASGVATEEIVLLELSTARLRFVLTTNVDHHHALPPGTYQLRLDFRRNKIAFLTVPGLTETLATLTIPLRIGKETAPVQVLDSETPECLLTGTSAPVSFRVRRIGDGNGKSTFHIHWLNEQGMPCGTESTLSGALSTEAGATTMLTGSLPPAPAQPGWYWPQLLWNEGAVTSPLLTAATRVTTEDIRAQFLSVELPVKVTGAEKSLEVPVAVRNEGLSDWPAHDTRLRYQWLTWDGRTIPHADGAVALGTTVKARNALTERFTIAPPSGIGAFRCAFNLESHGQPAVLVTNPLAQFLPVVSTVIHPERFTPLDLTSACNDFGAQSSLSPSTEKVDLDGEGNAFPLEDFLPDRDVTPFGYKPGCNLLAADPTAIAASVGFRFAPADEGRAPMVRANGQDIPLPAQAASALYLVALNTGHENPAQFTVSYTAGDPQPAEVNIAYWLADPTDNAPVMWKTRYLRTTKGDDWYAHGSLFVYRIAVDPQRKLKTLTLPKMPGVCLFAVTLESP